MTERDLFLALLDLPDAAARSAFLDNACAGDAALRARVEALLQSHDDAGSFLGQPALPPAQPDEGTTQEVGAPSASDDREEADGNDLSFLAASSRPDSLGRIGHYEVLQILGRGGFGIVFRAFDEVLQRVVALKVLAPAIAATSPARKRFLREARSSAQVRHENVVQAYEVGEQPLPYIAMEFIPGETLQQRLDRVGPMEAPEIVRIGRQIAEGLAAAHATGLIHRDIKPANVLLEGGHQRVKITDFGLARAADDASLTQSGVLAGTPMYMAPEQAKGETLDHRADLFSLGSVLYVMAAGRPPFRASTTFAVLKRVVDDAPRPIRELIPEMPQWLCDIIAKLHAKKPEDRFQSAREVADVLADCEAQLKANARLKDYSRIPRSKPAARKSGRWKWVAAAALLLPVLTLALTEGAGITHLLRGREPDAKGSSQNQQPTAVSFKYGDPEYTNTLGMKFKLIPAGKFTMGSSKEEIDRCLKPFAEGAWQRQFLLSEGPEHEVEITQPFYMGATHVTVRQFRQFVEEENYPADVRWKNPGFEQTDNNPVVFVSWQNAVDFCNWLSKKEGKQYRLPTEAEWEYCCRAGKSGTRYCFGDDDAQLENYAWYDKNSGGGTQPVGKKQPNDWGLYDMHGNAWEWCHDYGDFKYYERSPAKDPMGPGAGGDHVTRGGSWNCVPVQCRSALRGRMRTCSELGFRVLLVSPPGGVRIESGAKDKPAPPAIAPFTDADVQRIAALPAAEQVEEVRKELKRRNPGFDGKMETKIEGGVVTELRIVTDKVTDIAPIRVFDALRVLDCGGTNSKFNPNGQLTDLTPLKGMNLAALTSLKLSSTKVGDAGMVYFKDCKNLTDLDLFLTQVSDAGLVHFKDCKALTHLYLGGTKVSDAGLANFKDCKNLTDLWLDDMQVGDAGMVHFQDCKDLTDLNLAGTKVSDVGLANFKDCKNLKYLWLDRTQVSDAGLAQFRGMSLRMLSIDSTAVTDLTPLRGMTLEEIRLTPRNITQGLDILREMKSLKTIGVEYGHSWPAAEFWERYDKGEFGAAFTDADVKRIAALPAAEQVEEVRKELMRRNPGFDGKVESRIEGGVVTEIHVVTDQVTDISPLRVFNALRVLDCSGTHTPDWRGNGQLADLTPLKGMNVAGLTELHLSFTNVGDAGLGLFKDCKNLTQLDLSGTQATGAAMAHFKDCKDLSILYLGLTPMTDAGLAHFKDFRNLTLLYVNYTQVTDAGLAYLKECKNLRELLLDDTTVTDAGLAHLKDCKDLTVLSIHHTQVTDLSLLKGMPLKELTCDFQPERNAEILRSIKTLETINGKPAEEFWKGVEQK